MQKVSQMKRLAWRRSRRRSRIVGGGARRRHAPGKYATTIKSPAQFKGTWVLNLAKGGTYTVNNGQFVIRGRYATAGSRITFGRETGDGACAKSGTYTWRRNGKTLRFRGVSESPACSGRSGILAHSSRSSLNALPALGCKTTTRALRTGRSLPTGQIEASRGDERRSP